MDTKKRNNNTPGIVFSFDDRTYEQWEKQLDLFSKYNTKVTFFVTDDSVTNFMLKAQDRGHEIGYHTITHPHLSELSKEEFYKETISCIGLFKDAGIELTSFAYPFGDFQPWMHDELLKYYKILRGFDSFIHYTLDEMKSGFVISASIDAINHQQEEIFQKNINDMLQSAVDSRKIINLTTHEISDYEWGITPERLEYFLKKCREYGLTFYTYKDLQ